MKRFALIIILQFCLQGLFYPSSGRNSWKTAHFAYKIHIYNNPVPVSSRFNNILLPPTLGLPTSIGIFPSFYNFQLSKYQYGGSIFHPGLLSGNFFEIQADYLLHAGNATIIFPEIYRIQTNTSSLSVSPKD